MDLALVFPPSLSLVSSNSLPMRVPGLPRVCHRPGPGPRHLHPVPGEAGGVCRPRLAACPLLKKSLLVPPSSGEGTLPSGRNGPQLCWLG